MFPFRIEIKYSKIFINNEFVDSVSKKTYPTINPHDESIIAHVAEGDKADVDLAVAAARKAFHRTSAWRQMPPTERGLLLLKLADLFDRDIKYLSYLESLDCGKTYNNSESEIKFAATVLRYYSGKADNIQGKTIPIDGDTMCFTLKEPVGVCAGIIPWNYPIPIMTWKIAPALAAGCTMVLKPAEQTPLTALAVAALVREAGFPPGILNVVPGYGPTVGAALTHHPHVDKVSFTGSSEVGRTIMKAAAAVNLKRVTLELGGNCPIVVFKDADIMRAAQVCQAAAFANSGQCCVAATRTYVQSDVYDKFVDVSVELANRIQVGNPFEEKQGPQIDRRMYEKVLNYIESAKKEGARCLAGGNKIDGKGFYIQPTVFVDVKDDMKIAREEIFGPVQCIFKFDKFAEVVDRANDSKYGLGAGVITKDLQTALAFAKHVRSGSVWVNTYDHVTAQTPFGGFKESGFGREMGDDGMQEYLETKTVVVALSLTIDTKNTSEIY